MTDYYAVSKGFKTGIFTSWSECNKSISGYSGAKYNKCDSLDQAQVFLKQTSKTKQKSIKDFFSISKNELTNNFDFSVSKNTTDINKNPDILYIYTDGSCINNGKKNARAGIGIYFSENDSRNVSRKIEGKQTNNTAELTAIIDTFKLIQDEITNNKKVCIFTDSQYSIKCVNGYGEHNNKAGWKDDIPNKKLVREIYTLFYNHKNVEIKHIKAHTGKTDIHSKGNENADKLANKSIQLDTCPYNVSHKIYLNIPFSKKGEIKKMGGKWDRHKKKWYIYENNPLKSKILLL